MLPRALIIIVLMIFSAYAGALASPRAQAIIIDTDIHSDVDDVGALAVANVLHNCGLAELKGLVVNTHSKYGVMAANAICTYYGNGHIPIGGIRPLTSETFFDNYSFTLSEYASKTAYNWPRTLEDASHTPNALQLYRSLLASSAINSIHLISIGFLTNLAELLKSQPDEFSGLTGSELVSSKVSELIVMGGRYPTGWEFNFGGYDIDSTIYVLDHWPQDVAITFSGAELGGNIFSGQDLAKQSPPDSPILAAYQWYCGRCSTIRESWDPLTTLYAILGLEGFESLGVKSPLKFANRYGYNSVTSRNGSNAWIDDTNVQNQHWLQLADDVTNSSVAWILNQLFAHDPRLQTCFVGSGNILLQKLLRYSKQWSLSRLHF